MLIHWLFPNRRYQPVEKYRTANELLDAVANNEFITDEEAIFLSIWEIVIRPDSEKPALAT